MCMAYSILLLEHCFSNFACMEFRILALFMGCCTAPANVGVPNRSHPHASQ
jgi:hypothetical protein